MTMWQILGMEPTDDPAAIRRAYAQQLKLHRPDSDPQGYQQLREAYEQAKVLAADAQCAVASFAEEKADTVNEKWPPRAGLETPSKDLNKTVAPAFAKEAANALGAAQPLSTMQEALFADDNEELNLGSGKEPVDASGPAESLNAMQEASFANDNKGLLQASGKEPVDASGPAESLNAMQEASFANDNKGLLQASGKESVDASGPAKSLSAVQEASFANDNKGLLQASGKEPIDASGPAKSLSAVQEASFANDNKGLLQASGKEPVDASGPAESLSAIWQASSDDNKRLAHNSDRVIADKSGAAQSVNALWERLSTGERERTAQVLNKPRVDVMDTNKPFYAAPVWAEQELDRLADTLVADEMRGIKMLESLWNRVTQASSLPQQLQFHRQLGLALSQRAGLNNDVLENVSTRLGWGLDEYNATRVLTPDVLDALETRLRATEVERGQQQLTLESKTGGVLLRLANRLLQSARPTAPFWMRLVPGLVAETELQVYRISNYYPALLDHLNPQIIGFVLEPRLALNWRNIMLFAFWSLLFSQLLHAPHTYIGATLFMAAVVFFWLFGKEAILMGLSRWRGAAVNYLAIEFVLSSTAAIAGVAVFSSMGFRLNLISTAWGPLAQMAAVAVLVIGIYWRNWSWGGAISPPARRDAKKHSCQPVAIFRGEMAHQYFAAAALFCAVLCGDAVAGAVYLAVLGGGIKEVAPGC